MIFLVRRRYRCEVVCFWCLFKTRWSLRRTGPYHSRYNQPLSALELPSCGRIRWLFVSVYCGTCGFIKYVTRESLQQTQIRVVIVILRVLNVRVRGWVGVVYQVGQHSVKPKLRGNMARGVPGIEPGGRQINVVKCNRECWVRGRACVLDGITKRLTF